MAEQSGTPAEVLTDSDAASPLPAKPLSEFLTRVEGDALERLIRSVEVRVAAIERAQPAPAQVPEPGASAPVQGPWDKMQPLLHSGKKLRLPDWPAGAYVVAGPHLPHITFSDDKGLRPWAARTFSDMTAAMKRLDWQVIE